MTFFIVDDIPVDYHIHHHISKKVQQEAATSLMPLQNHPFNHIQILSSTAVVTFLIADDIHVHYLSKVGIIKCPFHEKSDPREYSK